MDPMRWLALLMLLACRGADSDPAEVDADPCPATGARVEVGSCYHNFPDVPIGESATEIIRFENLGTAPLCVTLEVDTAVYAVASDTLTVEPRDIVGVQVSFTPENDAVILAKLLVGTNDPDARYFACDLRGNGDLD